MEIKLYGLGQSSTHAHNTHLHTQSCTHFYEQIFINLPVRVHVHTQARNVQGADADEGVAAFGLRQMMNGRELMTVLGGCSLPFFFPSLFSHHSLILSLFLCPFLPLHLHPSLPPVMSDGGRICPASTLPSCHSGCQHLPHSPLFCPVQFIELLGDGGVWGRGGQIDKEGKKWKTREMVGQIEREEDGERKEAGKEKHASDSWNDETKDTPKPHLDRISDQQLEGNLSDIHTFPWLSKLLFPRWSLDPQFITI